MKQKKSSNLFSIRLLVLLAVLLASWIFFLEIASVRRDQGQPGEEVVLLSPLQREDDPNLAILLDQSMVQVPAGVFWMGSNQGRRDERPLHQVYLDGYQIDRFEVTNLQYQRFLKDSGVTPPLYWEGINYPAGQAVFPVVGVRWKDAAAYCTWAGKRLPTEAEWEKACRGPDQRSYPWGNSWREGAANTGSPLAEVGPEVWDQAWSYLKDPHPAKGDPSLQPVGSYPEGVSCWGVHDLVGNASEWVMDYYNWDGYWEVADHNPLITEPRWNHCLRGSAWWMPVATTVEGYDLNRCAARSSSHGSQRDARTGFRCASSLSKRDP